MSVPGAARCCDRSPAIVACFVPTGRFPARRSSKRVERRILIELQRKDGTMPQRKKIEIFTAGCSTCSETVELVKRIAGVAHDVEILDMHQAHIAAQAK